MIRAPELGNSPFHIFCKNCGHPAEFSIEKQSYACPACGETTGIEEVKEHILQWKKMQDSTAQKGPMPEAQMVCPTCGATILFPEGDMTEVCSFCGSKLVRKEFEYSEDFPEMIIPFRITEAQAREALNQWARENKGTKEAAVLLESLGKLEAYYLPYKMVRGPVEGFAQRNIASRLYECQAFVEGALVNVSRQLDNDVLDAAEPFDPGALRPFEHGYIAGHKVKLCDVNGEEASRRMFAEAAEDIRPVVEKVLENNDVAVRVVDTGLSEVPVLLPMYFIKTEAISAAVNGETGKVAVSVNIRQKKWDWMWKPGIFTAICGALAIWAFGLGDFDAVAATCGCTAVVAMISFALFSSFRHNLETKQILTGKEIEGIPPKKHLLPIFHDWVNGKRVPVRYQFHYWLRSVVMYGESAFILLLPVILALLIHLVFPEEGKSIGDLGFGDGAAWYVLSACGIFMYWIMVFNYVMYDYPIIYRIMPDGTDSLVTRNIRLYVLPNAKRWILDVFGWKKGLLFVGFMLFLLIGSVAAILDG